MSAGVSGSRNISTDHAHRCKRAEASYAMQPKASAASRKPRATSALHPKATEIERDFYVLKFTSKSSSFVRATSPARGATVLAECPACRSVCSTTPMSHWRSATGAAPNSDTWTTASPCLRLSVFHDPKSRSRDQVVVHRRKSEASSEL